MDNSQQQTVWCYFRVSTGSQTFDSQKEFINKHFEKNRIALKAEESPSIIDFARKRDADIETKNLRKELNKVPNGATIYTSELSRLGCRTLDVLALVEDCSKRDVQIYCIKESMMLEAKSPLGKLLITMLTSFAELELIGIRERIQNGVDAAKAKGVRFGREKGCDTSKASRAAGTASTNRKLEWYSNSIMARDIKRMIDSGEYGEVIVNTINAQLQDEIELKKPIEHVTQKGLELNYKRLEGICTGGGWKLPRWSAERACPQNDMGYTDDERCGYKPR